MFEKVVFIDRDGVINENRDSYVRNPDELIFLPGSLEALAILHKHNIDAVVISNQAGVGKGLISTDDLSEITGKMNNTVESCGGHIKAVYYCMHIADDMCECRKPKPGLINMAKLDLKINTNDLFLIGDASSDIEAGFLAGCKTILVLCGRTSEDEVENWIIKPDHIAKDLKAAIDLIVD